MHGQLQIVALLLDLSPSQQVIQVLTATDMLGAQMRSLTMEDETQMKLIGEFTPTVAQGRVK